MKLARKWAYLLSESVYLPMPHQELERRLLLLVDRVLAAVTHEPFVAAPAAGVGADLVALHGTGRTSLQCTLDILGKGLLGRRELRRTSKLEDRVVAVLAALASGYADALRMSVFDQQESISGALAETVREITVGLKLSETRNELLFSRSTSGIAVVGGDGTFVRANGALREILDRPAEDFERLTLFDMMPAPDAAAVREIFRELRKGTAEPLRQRRDLIRGDGESVLTGLVIWALHDGSGNPEGFAVIVDDVTELSLLQARLSHQSLHDALTGLPNRQFFTTHLEKVLRKAEGGVTMYHLDLDAFSVLSGGLGREVGDRLLRNVADRLKAVFARERAMVARLGGDEFGVLVENSPTTPGTVATIARINEALAEPSYIEGHGVAVSASVGVVSHPPPYIEPGELLRASDVTLRRARGIGHRQWALFDADQDSMDREGFGLAADMPGAWENGEVMAVYQPVIQLAGDRVVGVEALLHWDHPELGVLRHDQCVRLAERTGLSLLLGPWLLHSACERAAKWGLPVSFGLTPSQSHDPDLVGAVLKVLDETKTSAGMLRLGFPLPALATDGGEAPDNLRVLADVGVASMVHDFPGGPTALTYLEDLPMRGVRFTRRLVDRHARGTRDRFGIEESVTGALRTVQDAGLLVVVDGIGTKAQARWWRDAGADLALGSFFAPAGSADDFARLLGQRTTATTAGEEP